MRNKKSQTMGIAIIVAITIFIIGMLSVNYLKPEIVRVRDSDNLDCSNSDISDGSKLTCLAVDIVVPYFFILIFSVAGGIITARFLL